MDIVGTNTSFIVLPGAIAMEMLDVPVPTEIHRNARSYKGGGTTDVWYRWGYVACPAGYDWKGASNKFPSDAEYMYAIEGSSPKALASVASGTLASTSGTWERKFQSALSLGILPVFHS